MANYYTQTSFTVEDPSGSLNKMLQSKEEDGGLDFQWESEAGNIWFFMEESGDVDELADLLQRWLVAENSDQVIRFGWANTCSKPRLESFGGGCCVVTRTKQRWMTTSQMAYGLSELDPGMSFEVKQGKIFVELPDQRIITIGKDGVE